MRQFAVGSDYVQEFDGLADMVTFIETVPASLVDSDPSYPADWYGGLRTRQDAFEMLHNGWGMGAERIRQLAQPLYGRISTRILRPAPYFDVTGETIDMNRYLSGDPETFIVWGESETEVAGSGHKIVSIAIDMCCSGFFSSEDFFQRGGPIAALVDLLELSGRRVELSIVCVIGSTRGERICKTIIPIKRAAEPYNPEQVAFAIAHVGMYRHLIFAAQCRTPQEIAQSFSFSGDGTMGHFNSRCNLDTVEADVKVSGMELGRVGNVERWLIDQLEAQGVILD